MKVNRTTSLVRAIAFAAALLFGLALATWPTPASAQQSQDESQVPASVDPNYVLGPEDVLTIITRDVPECTGDFMVRLDGHITFPIVGEVMCAGESVDSIQKELKAGLSKELRSPQVSVNVKIMRMRRIYVLGAVKAPSVYDYKKGWRLSELIAQAGGLSQPAQRLKAILFRTGEPTKTIPLRSVFIDGDDAADVELKPGDVVNVREEPTIRVTVVGQVNKSGLIEIYEGQGAVEAVAGAGGYTTTAALSRAVITRKGKEIPVDLYGAIVNGESSKNVADEDGDTVTIPEQYQQVSVVGTVTHPGPLLLPDGRTMTLSQAVSEAGGLAPRAKQSVILTRMGNDGKLHSTSYSLKTLGSPKHLDPVLQDKDVVFIPQSGAASLGDFLNISQLYYTARALLRGY